MSHISSDGRSVSNFGPTLSYASSTGTPHRPQSSTITMSENDQFLQLSELRPPESYTGKNSTTVYPDSTIETSSHFVGERLEGFLLPPNSVPRPFYGCTIPPNKVQLILQISKEEIDQLLAPIDQGILSSESILAIRDWSTNLAFSISAQELIDILKMHGRFSHVEENHYETVAPDAVADTPTAQCHAKWNRRKLVVVLCIITFIVLVIIAAVLLGTFLHKGNGNDNGTRTTTEPSSSAPQTTDSEQKYVLGIFITGGHSGSMPDGTGKSVEYYDALPENINGPSKNAMISSRQSHTAGIVYVKYVIVTGGVDDHNDILDTSEIYNPTINGEWVAGPNMKTKRDSAAGAVFFDQDFLVCGGADGVQVLKSCEMVKWHLDGTINEWKFVEPMSSPRKGHEAVQLAALIYMLGGTDQTILSPIPFDTVESYSPNTNKWTTVTPMKVKRAYFGASSWQGMIIACGGYSPSWHQLSSCEQYNPFTAKWTMINSMNSGRNSLKLISFIGGVYALGGVEKGVLKSAKVFNETDAEVFNKTKWTITKDLSRVRSSFAAVTVGYPW